MTYEQQPVERGKKAKKKPRKVNGKRVQRRKKNHGGQPKTPVYGGSQVVTVIEGYGVTPDDQARALHIALGLATPEAGR